MSHWIKNIFASRKKEKSDDELIEDWNNSDKKLGDFQESILKITNQEKRSKCILEEGLNVVIPEDVEDIKNFLTVIASLYQTEKQLYIGINVQKQDKNYKRLVELIKRIEFYQGLYNIIVEFSPIDDKSKNFSEIKAKLSKIINLNLLLRANKYENLSLILSQIAVIQNENKELSLKIKDYLFYYFFSTESEYYKCLEYFLLKIEGVTSPDLGKNHMHK
jgi:hypothetical protein